MTEAPNADQDAYWNSPAGQNWADLQVLMDRQLEPLGLAAQRALDPKPGEHLIDIGCGAGQSTLSLARAVGPTGSVLGLDLSRPMIKVAQGRAEAAELAASFAVQDVQTAAWARAYDGAYSRFGVMFFLQPVAGFTAILNALKPGGPLAFVCWRTYGENPWMGAPIQAAAPFLPPSPPPSDPLAPGPFAFADPDRIRAILKDAGFVKAEIQPFDEMIGGGDLDDAMTLAQRIGPLGSALRENPDAAPKALEAVRPVLEQHLQPDGRVLMPAAVWIVTAQRP